MLIKVAVELYSSCKFPIEGATGTFAPLDSIEPHGKTLDAIASKGKATEIIASKFPIEAL